MPAIIKTSALLFMIFLLSGCSPASSLKRFDQKLGEIFFNEEHQEEEKDGEENTPDSAETDSKNLTKSQKNKIDRWLEENGLNRFGDPIDMMYLGGTPLFDESTGKSIERYEYLLDKFPDILEKIE